MGSHQPFEAAAQASGWQRRWLAVLLALLVTVAAFEVLARWVFPVREVPEFDRLAYSKAAVMGRPFPLLGHKSVWWLSEPDGAHYSRSLNLYGFNGPEWRLKKRQRVRRIVFVGDSFTEGLGAAEDADVAAQFERLANRGGRRVEVLNMGVEGYDLIQYLPLIRDAIALFQPDEILLVLYMNDLYVLPERPEELLKGAPPAIRKQFWKPRWLDVLERVRQGVRVPRRWREPAGNEPQPYPVAGRLRAGTVLSDRIDLQVDPEIAASMRAGRLNPAISGLLRRSEATLAREINPSAVLEALDRHMDATGTDLLVAYLPSLLQVSDAYLEAQRRMSAPIEAASLTEPHYQRQAESLTAVCAQLGIEFFDLTPTLRAVEASGRRLFWPYDGHMTDEGYAVTAQALYNWRRQLGPIEP